MPKKAVIFIADGSEPVEVVAPIDVLRRGGVDVVMMSTMGEHVVMAQGIAVMADQVIGNVDLDGFDMLIVPGGSVGVENLLKCQPMCDALKSAMASGKLVASICAGSTVLNALGLLEGYKATCYPGCESGFPDGVYVDGQNVVVDRNLITATGPATALEFGYAMLRALQGEDVADEIVSGMLFKA